MSWFSGMGKLFGGGQIKCAGCGARFDKGSEYCDVCGLAQGSLNRPVQREAILVDNRWEPAADELAVYFKLKDLSGFFSKDLHVPSGAIAWVLGDGRRECLQPGTYPANGTFFQNLNNFFRDKHVEILIARQGAALPIEFSFPDITTAEYLKLHIQTKVFVGVDVGNIAAFQQHFMRTPGALSTAELKRLLEGSVRQIVAEFLGVRGIRELAGLAELRKQLDEVLLKGLANRFSNYGLVFDQADTLEIRHDKLGAMQEKQGSFWLLIAEKRIDLEQQRQLDELYTEAEWQKIRHEAEQIKIRLARHGAGLGETLDTAKLDTAHRVDMADLSQDEAEKLHLIEQRKLNLYEQVIGSKTRTRQIDLDAAEELRDIEHELKHKGLLREGEIADWEQVQALARIKLQTVRFLADLQAKESVEIERRRIEHEFDKLRLNQEIESARLIEDESTRQENQQRLKTQQETLFAREQEVLALQHKQRAGALIRAEHAMNAEAEMAADWAKSQYAVRKAEVARDEALKDAKAGAAVNDIGIEGQIKQKEMEIKLQTLQHELDQVTRKASIDMQGYQHRQQTENRKADIEIDLWQAERQAAQREMAATNEAARRAADARLDAEMASAEAKVAAERKAEDARIESERDAQKERERRAWVDTVKGLPPEMVAILSGNPEVIALVSDMISTNTFAGMTPVQIALAALAKKPNAFLADAVDRLTKMEVAIANKPVVESVSPSAEAIAAEDERKREREELKRELREARESKDRVLEEQLRKAQEESERNRMHGQATLTQVLGTMEGANRTVSDTAVSIANNRQPPAASMYAAPAAANPQIIVVPTNGVAPQVVPAAPAAPQAANQILCPQCRELNPVNFNYCGKCRAPLR